MLRHARLLKQFRFTFLCLQIEGGPARGECQCDDRCANWLHTNFDQSSVNMFGYLLKVGAIKRTEIARLLMRFDHIASFIVNANHRIVRVSDEDLHKN